MRLTRKKITLNAHGGYIDPEAKTDGVEIDPRAIVCAADIEALNPENDQKSECPTKIGSEVIICDGVRLMGQNGELHGPIFIGEGTSLENGIKLGTRVFIGKNNDFGTGMKLGEELEKHIGDYCVFGSNNNFICGTRIGDQTMIGGGIEVDFLVSFPGRNIVGDDCSFGYQVRLWPNRAVGSNKSIVREGPKNIERPRVPKAREY